MQQQEEQGARKLSLSGHPESDCPDFGNSVAVMFPGSKGSINCRLTMLSRTPPPPLPGGYAVGEKVYFTGMSMTFEDGDKLTHGQSGEVVGPANRADGQARLAMRFPGNKGDVECSLTQLSREPPPPLPGAPQPP